MDNVPSFVGKTLSRPKAFIALGLPANSDSKTMMGQKQLSVHIRSWRIYGSAILLVADKAINAKNNRIIHIYRDDKKRGN
mgnify:CR=1 FL=1